MKLSVGDVVFVLDKKSQAVVPCQLVERISSVTLDGEDIKNIVSTPTGKKFTLEEYDSVWFESYDQAYDYLKKAAISLVDATMARARDVCEKSFGYTIPRGREVQAKESHDNRIEESESKEPENVPGTALSSETEEVFVDLGGQKVRVTLPKEYGING